MPFNFLYLHVLLLSCVTLYISFLILRYLHVANNLTNRFHFAVRLYSDNAQMTSKHAENKEVRASSVTDVLTTF